MAAVSDFWRSKVLSALHGRDSITRAELKKITGLNVASVSLVLRELIDFGIVQSLGKLRSSGGRKSEILRLNPEAAYFAAVDLARTPTRFAFLNLAGDVRYRWEQPFPQGAGPTVENIAEGLRRMLDRLTAPERARTVAVGVSYTGLLNARGELTAVNLGWENVPLARLSVAKTP